jgi:thioredoxin-like negative regulator of GroEL/mono/diheme cytochrome c family protein
VVRTRGSLLLAFMTCAGAWHLPGLAASAAQRQEALVTFNQDVAPILFDACATCHRPSGGAPFSLLSYADARSRARAIADTTRRRTMPPWKPERGYGQFAGERRLSDGQIAAIQQWVAQGAHEGDPATLPAVPVFTNEWQLGQPDLVLETEPYVVPSGARDIDRNFVVPVPVDRTRFVRAWQLLPGNRTVVHHATMEFDSSGSSRRLDAGDPLPGFEGLIPHTVRRPDGFFLGWTPGHLTSVAPADMAWPLRPGSDLVMMLHLRPSDRAEPVQARLGLYLSDAPPTRTPIMLRLTRQDLDIPPGQRRHVVDDSFTLAADVDAYSIQPHAHYLAREVKAFATRPGGDEEPLIHIRDWDFDWQGAYTFRRPVFLPAGTRVTVEYIYDNSVANRRNPHSPPRRVTYGQETSDEMAELWIQVVPRRAADRTRLTQAIEADVTREEIVGREKMLERDPGNIALHNDAALLHVSIGNLERAAAHFAEALRLAPASAPAHYNLGNTLLGQGKLGAAADLFAKALALDAGYALAHDGLGLVRRAEGNLERAIEHHQEAVRLAPHDVDAHVHLADALRLRGRLEDALTHYRQALQMDPAHAAARAEATRLEREVERRIR